MDEKRKNRRVLTQWVETQRARPQFRAAPSAGMAVSRVIRPLARKHGGGSSALSLEKIWPEIMGPRWSKISTPVRFIGGKEGRALVISAPGPAASLILAQSGPIIERLNAHLGAGHIKRLKLVQSRMTAPADNRPQKGLPPRKVAALQAGLADIQNDKLKAALEKMGRGVMTHDK